MRASGQDEISIAMSKKIQREQFLQGRRVQRTEFEEHSGASAFVSTGCVYNARSLAALPYSYVHLQSFLVASRNDPASLATSSSSFLMASDVSLSSVKGGNMNILCRE